MLLTGRRLDSPAAEQALWITLIWPLIKPNPWLSGYYFAYDSQIEEHGCKIVKSDVGSFTLEDALVLTIKG